MSAPTTTATRKFVVHFHFATGSTGTQEVDAADRSEARRNFWASFKGRPTSGYTITRIVVADPKPSPIGRKTVTKTVAELVPGDVIVQPASLNSKAFTGTVESVEPWILGAGRHAGQQATDNHRTGRGKPLFTVIVVDVVTTGEVLFPERYSDVLADDPVRHLARPLDATVQVQA